jgi:ribosomal protein S18 acetylase RimI-like enzyme
MKINIRKSVPADVYGIREVQKVTWLKTYPNREEGITVEDIKEKFKIDETSEGKKKIEEKKKKYEDRNSGIWVAEDKGKIIGFCMAIRETKHNRIEAIYVLPAYQGKGLGTQLIERAFSWLGEKKNIMINVARYNKQAIGFYKKFGFVETGRAGALDSAARLPSGKFIPEIELVKNCSKK